MKSWVCVCTAIAVAALLGGARPLPAAEPVSAEALVGRWTGSKLRCQKEEGILVRCGTPAPFEISFAAGGTGTTTDYGLPRQFTWRLISATEIGITTATGGDEIKFFGVERDDAALTFQVYLSQPTSDPSQPAAASYVHWVFDVNRTE